MSEIKKRLTIYTILWILVILNMSIGIFQLVIFFIEFPPFESGEMRNLSSGILSFSMAFFLLLGCYNKKRGEKMKGSVLSYLGIRTKKDIAIFIVVILLTLFVIIILILSLGGIGVIPLPY